MDTADEALNPENVRVQGEGKNPWQGLTSKHSSPQEQASQRNGAFWPVLGTGGEVGAGVGRRGGEGPELSPRSGGSGLRACTALYLRQPGFSWTKSDGFVFVCSRLNDHVLGTGSAAVPHNNSLARFSCESPLREKEPKAQRG